MKHLECLAFVKGDTGPMNAPDGITMVNCSGFAAMFAPQTKTRGFFPQSRKAFLQEAAVRQAYLEQFMTLGTVIPLRPRFRFEQASPEAFVRCNEDALIKIHTRLKNAAQYQIMVKWTSEKVLSHFRDAKEIAGFFAQDTVNADHLQKGIKRLTARLARMIELELDTTYKELLLQPIAEDILFNCVVLIDDAKIIDLDQAVERIDKIWTEGFTIRQIGPAPASSFVSIDPVWVPSKAVDEAHRMIGLDRGASVEDVTNARKQALMTPGCDVGQIKIAAETVLRATALNQPGKGLYRCEVFSDQQSTVNMHRRAVA